MPLNQDHADSFCKIARCDNGEKANAKEMDPPTRIRIYDQAYSGSIPVGLRFRDPPTRGINQISLTNSGLVFRQRPLDIPDPVIGRVTIQVIRPFGLALPAAEPFIRRSA